jgi:hypothetical protein
MLLEGVWQLTQTNPFSDTTYTSVQRTALRAAVEPERSAKLWNS